MHVLKYIIFSDIVSDPSCFVLFFLFFFMVQTLETILGVPRNNPGFFPDSDPRAGKETGNKQGNIPDSLHGTSVSIIKCIM